LLRQLSPLPRFLRSKDIQPDVPENFCACPIRACRWRRCRSCPGSRCRRRSD
jgi:hypothetical protein